MGFLKINSNRSGKSETAKSPNFADFLPFQFFIFKMKQAVWRGDKRPAP